MTHRFLAAVPVAALLLTAPLSQTFAQDASNQPPAAVSEAPAPTAETLPGIEPQGRKHRRCRHHGGSKAGDGAGKRCKTGHHGKRNQQVVERLERIEQRQILIETMLRQLLERGPK